MKGVGGSKGLLQRSGVVRGMEVEDVEAGYLQTGETGLQLLPNTGSRQSLVVPWIGLASHHHLLI